MGYKALGFAVWHGGKFFMRRRYPGAGRKAAMAAAAGGLMVSGLAVARVVRSSHQ